MARLEQQNRAFEQQNRILEQRIGKLFAELEAERRQNKRQAAPFSKEPPAAAPKKPGRKKGRRHGPHDHRAAPPRIDETYDVPLPCHCPGFSSGRVRQTGQVRQFQA